MNETVNKRENGVEIDLQDLLMTWLRRWVTIVICAVLAAGAAFLYTRLFVTPMYQASVMILVNNNNSNRVEDMEYVSNADLVTSQRLVTTYTTIISSDTVLQKVVDTAGVNLTTDMVRSMMTASQLGTTEIFEVYITHPDPDTAALLANAVAEVAPTEIPQFVEGSSTKIIDYARVPAKPFTPNYTKNVLMGTVVGVVLAIVWITLQFLLDVRINDSQDLERLFEYPVLGQIPDFDQDAAKMKNGYGRGYVQSDARARARAQKNAAAAGGQKQEG